MADRILNISQTCPCTQGIHFSSVTNTASIANNKISTALLWVPAILFILSILQHLIFSIFAILSSVCRTNNPRYTVYLHTYSKYSYIYSIYSRCNDSYMLVLRAFDNRMDCADLFEYGSGLKFKPPQTLALNSVDKQSRFGLNVAFFNIVSPMCVKNDSFALDFCSKVYKWRSVLCSEFFSSCCYF